MHKALPSTTSPAKHPQKYFPVFYCVPKFAQKSPSISLHSNACTKYAPVRLCNTKFAQGISQYYIVLQDFAQRSSQFSFVLPASHFSIMGQIQVFKREGSMWSVPVPERWSASGFACLLSIMTWLAPCVMWLEIASGTTAVCAPSGATGSIDKGALACKRAVTKLVTTWAPLRPAIHCPPTHSLRWSLGVHFFENVKIPFGRNRCQESCQQRGGTAPLAAGPQHCFFTARMPGPPVKHHHGPRETSPQGAANESKFTETNLVHPNPRVPLFVVTIVIQ